MGSAALSGKIAYLQRESAVPGTYDDITEVTEIGDLSYNLARLDATFHNSRITRDMVPGIADAIELNCTCNYIQAQYDTLWTIMSTPGTQVVSKWRILWPDTYYHEFEGYVVNMTSKTPLDGLITYDLTIMVTQDVTYDNTP